MLKCKRSWLVLLALFGVALAVYFEPTYCVRGWLHGEAFFDGRPTSYWRAVVERDLQLNSHKLVYGRDNAPPVFWTRVYDRIGLKRREDTSLMLLQNTNADAVLLELADDRNVHVAGFAEDIIEAYDYRNPARLKPDFPIVLDRHGSLRHRWFDILQRHHMK